MSAQEHPTKQPPRYPRLILEAPPQKVDELVGLLFSLGASGVEERDQSTLDKSSGTGRVALLASFESSQDASEALSEIDPQYQPRVDDVVGDEWRDSWKESFHPFHLTPSIVIRPPWEAFTPSHGEQLLVLEPGRAFGTGLHATTSLVAQALEHHKDEVSGKPILDVGCGTGILAFAAIMLGSTHARATDNDPDAIATVIENAAANGMAERIEADTTDITQVAGTYPVVVANIEAYVLIRMAEPLSARVAPGGLLILSGVLAEQEDAVVEAFKKLSVERVCRRDEWVSIELRANG